MSRSKPSDKPPKLPLPMKLVVGAVAGAVGTSCIFPIDMVKTRLQASGASKYSGPINCFQTIVRTEGGYRALYRGLNANLVGVIPEKAIKLAVNEYLREMFEHEDGSIDLLHEVIAGAGAGFCQVIATNPMEMSKIRLQMQATLPAAERQSFGQIVKSLGVRGLYIGTVATLSRDVPFSLLFFPGYANLKAITSDKTTGSNSISSLLLSGGAAGALAAAAVTPTDVIKTRLQMAGGKEKYKSFGNAFRVIVKEEGFGALYKGYIPRMAVVGPLFAITLLSFEALKAVYFPKPKKQI